MQAHTVCMGCTKRPLAPVLLTIGSEKMTNVPRLLRMDIFINLHQQLIPQISVLHTEPNAHCISRPILYVLEARNGFSPFVLLAIWSNNLIYLPWLLRMDMCINSYQQLAPQTSVLRTGPNAHSICRPILYVWEGRNCLSPLYCHQ